MKHIFYSLLDNFKGEKYLKNKIQDNKFEVLCMTVSLEKVDLECDNRLITNLLGCSPEYILTQTPCTYMDCYWIT